MIFFIQNYFESEAIHEGQPGLQRGLFYRLSGKLSPAPRCEREPHNRSLKQLGMGRFLVQLVLLVLLVQIVQAVQLGQLGLRDERVIGYQGRLSPLHSV